MVVLKSRRLRVRGLVFIKFVSQRADAHSQEPGRMRAVAPALVQGGKNVAPLHFREGGKFRRLGLDDGCRGFGGRKVPALCLPCANGGETQMLGFQIAIVPA